MRLFIAEELPDRQEHWEIARKNYNIYNPPPGVEYFDFGCDQVCSDLYFRAEVEASRTLDGLIEARPPLLCE